MHAVFFDVDGVLIDSMPAKGEAFAEALAPFGASPDEVKASHFQHGGMHRSEKIRVLLKQSLERDPTLEEVDEAIRRFEALVTRKVLECSEIQGASTSLAHLSTKSDLFAISATPTDELSLILSARGWIPYFRGIYGFPSRKSEVMRQLILTNGYEAMQCVMIGDSTSDRESAAAASVPFILVHSSPAASPWPSDVASMTDLSQLPDVISELWGEL